MKRAYKESIQFSTTNADGAEELPELFKALRAAKKQVNSTLSEMKLSKETKVKIGKSSIGAIRVSIRQRMRSNFHVSLVRTYRNGIKAHSTETVTSPFNSLTVLQRCSILKQLKKDIRHEISKHRYVQKHRLTTVERYGKLINKYGNVYFKSGTFLLLSKAKLTHKLWSDKKPMNDLNHVGVEIEFYVPGGIDDEDLAFEFGKAGLGDYVVLKDDGSIRCDEVDTAHEIAVIDTQRNIYKTIDKVCDVLSKVDANVNASCGLHIHLDMRNKNPQLVFNRLQAAQDFLFKLVPASRRRNDYTRKIAKGEITNFEDRYYAINPSAYRKYKTLEIRLHSGTTDSLKIKNWIKLLLAIAKKGTPKQTLTVSKWFDFLDVNKDLKKFYLERARKFNTESAEDPEHAELPYNEDDDSCPSCGNDDLCSNCDNSHCDNCGWEA